MRTPLPCHPQLLRLFPLPPPPPQDISQENALKYPELYRELQKRRHLSLKTFLVWTWKAIYQGGVIMLGAIFLFDRRLVHVVGITFTSLILTELLMVAVEVKRWHTVMIASEVRLRWEGPHPLRHSTWRRASRLAPRPRPSARLLPPRSRHALLLLAGALPCVAALCRSLLLCATPNCAAPPLQVVTLLVYAGSIFALSSPTLLGTSTFDLPFMLSLEFVWKVAAITAVSCVPVWVGKIFSQRLSPEKAMKIR
jgi:hypothetical protein